MLSGIKSLGPLTLYVTVNYNRILVSYTSIVSNNIRRQACDLAAGKDRVAIGKTKYK